MPTVRMGEDGIALTRQFTLTEAEIGGQRRGRDRDERIAAKPEHRPRPSASRRWTECLQGRRVALLRDFRHEMSRATGGDVLRRPFDSSGARDLFSAGWRTRPRPGTAFVMEAPFQVHHHRGHFGFGGCPEVGLSRSLFARSDFDCYSGGVDPPIVGGSPRYDFPVTGEGFLGGTEGAGATQAFGERASSDQPRTLLALEDGSEFALRDYWLEGHKLQYVTSYGGQNSLPVERIDLARTVKDNSERGVEFVLRPRPARTSEKAVRP